jgi:hypothetical protein
MRFAVKDFFTHEPLKARKKKNQYRRATYEEEQLPTIRYPSTALEFQETNSDEPYVTMRSAPNEYFEDGP